MGRDLTKWLAVIGIVAVCSWIPAYAQAPQEQGLVAHYTFDEGQGDVAKDHSGNNNDGKINGATWEKLGEGYALKFGSKKSFVDLGTEHNIPVTGDMTLTVWVKLMAAPYPTNQTNFCIVDCETYKKSGFLVRVSGHSPQIFYRASHEGSLGSKVNKSALKNFAFHHVAITRTGTNVTLYLDGTLDSVHSKIKQPLPPTRGLQISSRGQSFSGLLDEVKFYNRVLSAEEIQAEYQKGAKGHANQ